MKPWKVTVGRDARMKNLLDFVSIFMHLTHVYKLVNVQGT